MQINVTNLIRESIKQYHTLHSYPYTEDISVTSVLYCLRKAYFDYMINNDVFTYYDYLTEELDLDEKYHDEYLSTVNDNLTDWYTFCGKLIHVGIQKIVRDYLTTHEYNVIDEFKVTYPLKNRKLVGHIDILILENFDIAHIIELKTCYRIPEKPYKQHVYQIKAYANMLSRMLKHAEINGYIVYLQRNHGYIKTFEPITGFSLRNHGKDFIFEYVVKRAEFLIDSIENSNEPEGEITVQCRHCPYQNTCKAYKSYYESNKSER